MRLWPMTAELYAKDGWAFGQIAARQIRSAPSPACGGGLGRGWHARMSLVACPLPAPPPAGCGLARFRQILEVTKPRQAGVWLEEGTHRVLGNSDHAGPTRSIIAASSGGGAGSGERLGDLAGQAKMHGRERALEDAHARGAIEIGLRAAAGKMQHAVERTLRQRRRNVR